MGLFCNPKIIIFWNKMCPVKFNILKHNLRMQYNNLIKLSETILPE